MERSLYIIPINYDILQQTLLANDVVLHPFTMYLLLLHVFLQKNVTGVSVRQWCERCDKHEAST